MDNMATRQKHLISLMTETSVTNEQLLAALEEYEPESWGSYDAYGFEHQVQYVARAIQDIHQEREVPFAFGFAWVGVLEDGVDSSNIEVYAGDFVYLSRNLELKRLTDDREATGNAQALAIRDALMSGYADLLRFVKKHNITEA